MAKSITEMMDDLREDLARWRLELSRVRAEGHITSIRQLEKLISDAEFILARWENNRRIADGRRPRWSDDISR